MEERYKVHRRTFEASKHPKDSAERIRLNQSAITSAYMPSQKYQVIGIMGNGGRFSNGYRTKREAIEACDRFNRKG